MTTKLDAERLLSTHRLQGDRRQAVGGIFVLAATTALLAYNDFRILGTNESMMITYVVRLIYVVSTLALTIPILNSTDLAKLEKWITVNLLFFAFASLVVNWMKVPVSSDNLMLSAAAVVLFFVLFPISMKRHFQLAMVMTVVGVIVFIGRSAYLDKGDFAFFLLGYLFAIILGFLLSFNSYHSRDRELAALLLHEKTLAALDEDQQKVQTLQGLLKTCAECKKILDSNEDWVQMEVYIRDHSDADFSHGLCPPCYDSSLAQLEEHRNNS